MFVIGVAVNFSACNKDDDEDKVNADELVGTWEVYASKGWEIEDGENMNGIGMQNHIRLE